MVQLSNVNREQINQAKQVDILEYLLRNEPNNLHRVGKAYYLKDHDSLEISNGLWHWHSQGIGGRSVVDYLIKVRGFSFVEAVQHLTGNDVPSLNIAPKSEPPTKLDHPVFTLPPRNKDNERVVAYLQGRGVTKSLVLDCINRGSLYESGDMWHNCVFVGRDDNGKARFASLRGAMGDFKRDIEGSDKRYGFVLLPMDQYSNSIAVFESAIDALSHQVVCPGFKGWRLSLGCTALTALTNFLERHKGITDCIICTDADQAGNIAAAKIKEIKGIQTTRLLPPKGKNDWNDALLATIAESKPSLASQLESAKEKSTGPKKANAPVDVHKKSTLPERG